MHCSGAGAEGEGEGGGGNSDPPRVREEGMEGDREVGISWISEERREDGIVGGTAFLQPTLLPLLYRRLPLLLLGPLLLLSPSSCQPSVDALLKLLRALLVLALALRLYTLCTLPLLIVLPGNLIARQTLRRSGGGPRRSSRCGGGGATLTTLLCTGSWLRRLQL